MSRTFRYVQNDDVYKAFMEYRDSLLSERPVVIARHGDYSLYMRCLSKNELGLSIENTELRTIVDKRTYNINETTDALVSRGVRHACQKMSELSDRDVNRRRMQVWKWFVLEWQKNNADKSKEFMEKEVTWDERKENTEEVEEEILDIEAFLHGEYLNLGNTLKLIDMYVTDTTAKERFKKFAIADIMEMTSEDTKDKSIEEAEKLAAKGGFKRHTYQFVVSVEATDKEHARQALLSYLAGDARIHIQK